MVSISKAYCADELTRIGIGDGVKNNIYLLVNRDEHLDQHVHQLEKLYDVESVTLHEQFDESAFAKLDQSLGIVRTEK